MQRPMIRDMRRKVGILGGSVVNVGCWCKTASVVEIGNALGMSIMMMRSDALSPGLASTRVAY